MEMQMEVKDELGLALERLTAAAGLLEQASERMAGIELQGSLERVTAREAHLEQRLAEAEATIAAMRAEAETLAEAAKPVARRTTPAALASLVAWEGATPQVGALDAVLRSLSLEQRIAVKSEMMRTGLLSSSLL